MNEERVKIELDISSELLATYTLLRDELEEKKKAFSKLSKELDSAFQDLQRIRGEIHACLRIAFDEEYRLRKKAGFKDSEGAEPGPVDKGDLR